uniref:Uncharacterized protein n=1 Tax=Anguilla anguilla TaxID=7936 RepID=A0A0E9TXT2_ANGAN
MPFTLNVSENCVRLKYWKCIISS